jgi:hypothetical protein
VFLYVGNLDVSTWVCCVPFVCSFVEVGLVNCVSVVVVINIGRACAGGP